jgi:hypothetical protein
VRSFHADAGASVPSSVLLLSNDPITLALMGLLVELANFVPIFGGCEESPEETIARSRPVLIALIDDSLDAARSDVFFARAAQQRVPIAIFAGRGSRGELKAGVVERGIPYVELPTQAAELARVIRTAAAGSSSKRRASRRA